MHICIYTWANSILHSALYIYYWKWTCLWIELFLFLFNTFKSRLPVRSTGLSSVNTKVHIHKYWLTTCFQWVTHETNWRTYFLLFSLTFYSVNFLVGTLIFYLHTLAIKKQKAELLGKLKDLISWVINSIFKIIYYFWVPWEMIIY